jgi:pullulanase/glycogen debranching enzyme
VHLGSWKRHEEDNRFLTYLEFAEDLVAYVKETGFTHVEFMPIMETLMILLRGVSVSRLFCTDLSFWQSTRIYGASRPTCRNWRYSRLGTFPLPDDARFRFLMVPIFFDRKKRISSRLEKLGV